MTNWIQKSIEIANAKGYLDKLQAVYPINSNDLRTIPEETLKEIKEALESHSNPSLIKVLLDLEKFPIDDPYIGTLRAESEQIIKNPETANRIGKTLQAIGYKDLVSLAQSPKAHSRQMGSSFRNWLRSQEYEFRGTTDFLEKSESGLCFLDGNDVRLKEYANKKLGFELGDTKKGIDFVFRKGRKFCIGEAKFITTYGGTQTNQLDVALEVAELNQNEKDVYSAAVLDGVVWFNGAYLEKIQKREKLNIMTSLIFKEFVESF